MRPFLRLALALLPPILALAFPAWAERAPDLVLTGTLTGADHQTYREVPFETPRGVTRMTIRVTHDGQAERTVVDLGLRDPERFRGWSGGNKDRFVISATDATPSYLPGPLPAGSWRLVLGVPNIRKTSIASFKASIWFDRATDPFPGFVEAPVRAGPGWYRGDLHMHTAHSDGSCVSKRGVRVPCPVFRTLEAAATRGLDFIAVSDHNTTSQNDALRELAPYFDDLLLIPAREVTTFQGHANVWGPTAPLDFQLGGPRLPKINGLLDAAHAAGGLVSINHPGQPSGEICMGCGWTAADVDYAKVDAVEAVNGGGLALPGAPEGALGGIPFWEARLNAGFRITAVGGSDNHDAGLGPDQLNAVGRPTTVVHAAELSQPAILAAIRAGHVFIDVWGTHDRMLALEATSKTGKAEMGDELKAAAGEPVHVEVTTAGMPAGARLSLAGDGAKLANLPEPGLETGQTKRSFELVADGGRHWLRVDVRGPDGRILLLGNPIYLRPN
jgi:hypothetical protein